MAFIDVQHISKQFQIYQREKGLLKQLRSLVYRSHIVKDAVKDVSFQIEKGELVGYVGRNGAGKSTTIKMLSGILTPTSGVITVDGRIPYEERKQNAMHIGVVFGQRSQLYWDLPMEDTFALYKRIYHIEEKRFKKNVAFFVELLEMQEFLQQPIRQLSLGQKMRANIAVALLHDPAIVYLDEPTIGLDIIAKSKIRQFIREVNKEKQTTVILTTHDMDDIEYMCDRMIMIDAGEIIYDGSLSAFKNKYGGELMLTIEFADDQPKELDERFQLIKREGPKYTLLFRKDDMTAGEAITLITRQYDVFDLQLTEPDIEEIVKEIYSK